MTERFFPAELQPGESLEIPLLLSHDHGLPIATRITWTNEDGTGGEWSGKVR